MTGTEDANFAKSGDKRKARSKSRDSAKKAKTDDMDTSVSRKPVSRDKSGVRDPEQRKKLKKMEKKLQAKKFGAMGKSGESDRHIAVKKPRHLFSGKRGAGKTDRR